MAQRNTEQFSLSETEMQDIFNLSGDPNRIGSKGKALRTVLQRHKELIDSYAELQAKLTNFFCAY